MKTRISPFLSFVLAMILTISVQAQYDTLILQPGPLDGMDSEMRTDLPNTNLGYHFDFIANAWTASGNFFIQRSLIRFDLAPIPPGSTVIKATLDLYTNLNTGHYQLDSGPNASYFMRVLEPWLEDQVTWNNQPQATMNGAVIVPPSTSNTQTYYLDLTEHVQDMVDNPESNFGWLFRLQTEERYRCLVFSSSDHYNVDWRPRLTVIYSSCPLPKALYTSSVNNLTATFTDQSTNAQSWFWDFGDGDTSSQQNPIHTYPGAGTYQVCLTVINVCGNDNYCNPLEITCVLPQSGFYYESSYPNYSFFDTSYSGTVLYRLWDFGDGDTSSLPNPVHAYSAPGNYQVCLSIMDSCGFDTHCEMVAYYLPLTVNFTGTPSQNNSLYVEFRDFTEGSTWWKWSFGDGATSTIQNPSHLYLQYGTYEVCLEAGNTAEKGSHCDSIQLQNIMENSLDNRVEVFPNPTHDRVLLKRQRYTSQMEVSVFDILGNEVAAFTEGEIQPNEIRELNLKGYPKGQYLLVIRADDYEQTSPLVID